MTFRALALLTLAAFVAMTACGTEDKVEDGDTSDPFGTDTTNPFGDTGESTDTVDPWTQDGSNQPDGNIWPDTIEWPDGTVVEDGTVIIPDTDDPDDGGGTNPNQGNQTPNGELFVKILGPSHHDFTAVLGSVIALNGVVFGDADEVTWSSATGGSGDATGAPFFKTGPVQLVQGDNEIVVSATKDGVTRTDSIVITYNPSFRFDTRPVARPNALFTNSPTDVVVTAAMSLYNNFDASTVTLLEVDPITGNVLTTLGTMKDDGGANTGGTSGDEIQGDGIFTLRKSFNKAVPLSIYLRVSVVVDTGISSYTAYSPIIDIDVVEHFTIEECNAIVDLQSQATGVYEESLQGGDPKSARDAVIAWLETNPLVVEAGPAEDDGYGVWAYYSSGVLGAFNFNPLNVRGGAEADDDTELVEVSYGPEASGALGTTINITSKRALALSPSNTEFGSFDEIPQVASLLNDSVCPPFSVDGPYNGIQASMDKYWEMDNSGVVAMATHGDVYFGDMSGQIKDQFEWDHKGAQEVVWTGEAMNCGALMQSTKTCTISQGSDPNGGCPTGTVCQPTQNSGNSLTGVCLDKKQIDLKKGRLVIGNTGLGILPSFIVANTDITYPNSLVYLGSCRSMWNGSLAAEFFAAGAKAVFGYSGYVDSEFAFERGVELFQSMIELEMETGEAFTPSLADPNHGDSYFKLFGGNNVSISASDIINPSWETGDLTGWEQDGDGRVISKLGSTVPTGGKFMSVISTGMGYTLQVGAIKQTFCIPEDKNTVQFYWKYFSEEFKEWCGSSYQDPFTAEVKGAVGKVTLVDVTVDSLCPPEDCYGCGAQYKGLYPSDVSFDQGGVFNTKWQKATANISGLAGQGPVTFSLFVTDEGDSIYDTVILMDNIEFKTE